MKVSIIGAGPAGCYLGYLLARKGLEINIYEEHAKVGEPLQCAGIVTGSLNKILDIPEKIILNRVNKARIHSPKGFLDLNLKENLIINRIKFDKYLAQKAKNSGAKIHLNHIFIKFQRPYITLKHNNRIKHTNTHYLVGADGPLSEVAKYVRKPIKCWTGIQVRVELANNNYVDFYPYVGTFAWVIPENNRIVRIGLLAKKNANSVFQKFLKSLGNPKILDKQAGLVPIYGQRSKSCKHPVYLLGDAAAQVKATSGGGIIQGLTAAKCLANSILLKKDYEQLWKARLGKDLWLHLKIRKVLDKLTPEDYNKLIRLMNNNKVKKILQKFDRDYPTKFILKLLIVQPRLLHFLTKLW